MRVMDASARSIDVQELVATEQRLAEARHAAVRRLARLADARFWWLRGTRVTSLTSDGPARRQRRPTARRHPIGVAPSSSPQALRRSAGTARRTSGWLSKNNACDGNVVSFRAAVVDVVRPVEQGSTSGTAFRHRQVDASAARKRCKRVVGAADRPDCSSPMVVAPSLNRSSSGVVAAHGPVQPAAHGRGARRGSAPHRAGGPADRPSSRLLRVGLRGRALVGRSPVGRRRKQDQPVHLLDRPAIRHELAGQPVEQLGVRRLSPPGRSCGRWRPIPVPKWCCQTRLTMTRAVRGWAGSVSHAARRPTRPLRRSTAGGRDGAQPGKPPGDLARGGLDGGETAAHSRAQARSAALGGDSFRLLVPCLLYLWGHPPRTALLPEPAALLGRMVAVQGSRPRSG